MKNLTHQDLLEIIKSAEGRDHADFKTRRVWGILHRAVAWHRDLATTKTDPATDAGKTIEASGPSVTRPRADLGDIG